MTEKNNTKIRKVDLHVHTNFSDGIYTPEEILNKAKDKNIACIAITDHDNVDAIDEAIEIGNSMNIEVIPGVELSTEMSGAEVHMLGFFFDRRNPDLLDYLKRYRKIRLDRAVKIVEKLNELDIPLSVDDVLSRIKKNVSVGRPHVAYAMVALKFVDNYFEAFSKYLGDGKPAYVKKQNISPKAATDLIASAGGLTFVAHPGKTLKPDDLVKLINIGIDGVEIIHPSHSERESSLLQSIAAQYFLLESGGSDFHGGRISDEKNFGSYYVTESYVTAMKNRLFI